jgi:hypothetical protein
MAAKAAMLKKLKHEKDYSKMWPSWPDMDIKLTLQHNFPDLQSLIPKLTPGDITFNSIFYLSTTNTIIKFKQKISSQAPSN